MSTLTMSRVSGILTKGQSIWYDNLERRLIQSGAFQKMIAEDGIRGVTSNPTIFDKAISKSADYDADIYKLSDQGLSTEDVYWSLVIKDIQDVADIFKPVYDETKGLDGYVSLEVSPLLARDTKGTVRQALEFWKRVNRKNLMIKVPATHEGIPAISTLIKEGLNINVTLIFSIKRYQEVMDAYFEGLETRVDAGKPVDSIASVASFFVSRVDSFSDKVLDQWIADEECKDQVPELKKLRGKVAIANSKVAYRQFEKFFASDDFKHLKNKGARIQRPLWASTSTKNPEFSDVRYVEALIGPDTVNTVPPATLDAFRDHGVPESRLKDHFEDALKVIQTLDHLGVDLGLITMQLEDQGVDLFAKSYTDLLKHLEEKTAKLRSDKS